MKFFNQQALLFNQSSLARRIEFLENKNETKELFEDISGKTFGQITTYQDTFISQDDWANNSNAIALELDSGRPSQKTLFTASGEPIQATIDSNGNFALSGIPTATNYCICWVLNGTQLAFAEALIPLTKIIEEYDYDSPFVRNSLGDISPEITGDHLNLKTGGLKDSIRVIPLFVNRIEEKKENVLRVAKSGGDFTTIQGAIDDITDASSSKRYIIKISPGTYTENIICENYVYFEGEGYENTFIEGTIYLDQYNSFKKLTQKLNITSDTTIIDGATESGGDIQFLDFNIEITTTTSNVRPTITINKDNLYMENCEVQYINQSTGSTTSTTNLFDLQGDGIYLINEFSSIVITNQLSGDINIINDNNSNRSVILSSQNINQILNSSWNSKITFLNNVSTAGEHGVFASNSEMFGAGQGICRAINGNSGNSYSIIQSSFIRAIGFTENCVVNAESVGDIVDFTFCTKNTEGIFCGNGSVFRVYRDNGNFSVNTNIIDENLLIGTPTNKSLQDMYNIGFNAGWVSGQAITDNGDGTVDIALGTGYIRTSNDEQAPLRSFDIVAFEDIALTNNSKNYIYVDYNTGSPTILVTTTSSLVLDNENDKYEIWEVYREGTDLHITDHRQRAKNIGSRVQQRLYSINKIERANSVGGLIIAESGDGNRYVSMSGGLLWVKLNPIAIDTIDTSGTDVFDRYYLTSTTTWNKTTGNTTWNNTQYNDPATGLVTMTTGRYSFQEFWLESDNHLLSVFGTNQYTLENNAVIAPRVQAPPRTDDHAIYIGRIVFQKNATTGTAYTAFGDILLGTSAVSIHNNLSGLQGGASAEYYHLDATDYGNLTDVNAQLDDLHTDGDPTFRTITGTRSAKSLIINPNFGDSNTEARIYSSSDMELWLGVVGTYNIIELTTAGRVVIPGIPTQERSLQIENGADVSATSDGYFVCGLISDLNIAIDNNEIMARDNGSANTPLYLQNDAGSLYSKAVYNQTTSSSANVNVDSTGYIRRSTCGEIFKENIQDLTIDTSGLFDIDIKTFTEKNGDESLQHSVIANDNTYNALPQAVIKSWAIVHTPTNNVLRTIDKPENYDLIISNEKNVLWGVKKNCLLEELEHSIQEYEFREINDSINWNFLTTALILESRKLKDKINNLETRVANLEQLVA